MSGPPIEAVGTDMCPPFVCARVRMSWRRIRIRFHILLRGLPEGEHVHFILKQRGAAPTGPLLLSLRAVRGTTEPCFTAPWGAWTQPLKFEAGARGERRWLSLGLPRPPHVGEWHKVELAVTFEGTRVHRQRFWVGERHGHWSLTPRSAWGRLGPSALVRPAAKTSNAQDACADP